MARRAAFAISVLGSAAILLSGCAAAVVPLVTTVAAGKKIADAPRRSDKTPPIKDKPKKPKDKDTKKEKAGQLLEIPPQPEKPLAPPAGYETLLSYTLATAGNAAPVGDHKSAQLANPAKLLPTRKDCGILPPAIILDLDTGNSIFDPAIALKPHAGIADMLAKFRSEGITIFWISAAPSRLAASVQRTLIATGLDPKGTDRILLSRDNDDSKQARREEAGNTHCIAAIAGDTRADFDELYLYLKKEGAAKPLDVLMGAGWFLTPLPLTPTPPNISADKGQK